MIKKISTGMVILIAALVVSLVVIYVRYSHMSESFENYSVVANVVEKYEDTHGPVVCGGIKTSIDNFNKQLATLDPSTKAYTDMKNAVAKLVDLQQNTYKCNQ
jgi:hypothetical protein